jgi:hypothetical protein
MMEVEHGFMKNACSGVLQLPRRKSFVGLVVDQPRISDMPDGPKSYLEK